jgi:hypothetical protein
LSYGRGEGVPKYVQNCVHKSVTKRGLKSSDPWVRVWRGSGPGFGPDAGRWGDRMPGICVPGALEGNKGMVIAPGWSGGWCAGVGQAASASGCSPGGAPALPTRPRGWLESGTRVSAVVDTP